VVAFFNSFLAESKLHSDLILDGYANSTPLDLDLSDSLSPEFIVLLVELGYHVDKSDSADDRFCSHDLFPHRAVLSDGCFSVDSELVPFTELLKSLVSLVIAIS
jgi:hypothetical protein